MHTLFEMDRWGAVVGAAGLCAVSAKAPTSWRRLVCAAASGCWWTDAPLAAHAALARASPATLPGGCRCGSTARRPRPPPTRREGARAGPRCGSCAAARRQSACRLAARQRLLHPSVSEYLPAICCKPCLQVWSLCRPAGVRDGGAATGRRRRRRAAGALQASPQRQCRSASAQRDPKSQQSPAPNPTAGNRVAAAWAHSWGMGDARLHLPSLALRVVLHHRWLQQKQRATQTPLVQRETGASCRCAQPLGQTQSGPR